MCGVIRAFSKQDAERERFREASGDLSDTAVRVGKLSALLSPVTFLIMNTAIIAILWFGGVRVESGALSQGQIIALVNYMNQILLALIVVANLVVIFTKASASGGSGSAGVRPAALGPGGKGGAEEGSRQPQGGVSECLLLL